jgi:hypothetical protein
LLALGASLMPVAVSGLQGGRSGTFQAMLDQRLAREMEHYATMLDERVTDIVQVCVLLPWHGPSRALTVG